MAGEVEEGRERPVAVIAALCANIGIAVAKFVAAALTASSAMLAEALHSVVDTGNQVLLLVGVSRSRKPPDARHPYGYGGELYFWTLIVAVLLFGAGGGSSVWEGIHKLRAPSPPESALWGFVVLGIALVFESVSFGVAYTHLAPQDGLVRAVRRSKDPAKFLVVVEDLTAIAGLLVAAAGLGLRELLHSPVPDAVASIVIGLLLMTAAGFLVAETHGLVVGEPAARKQCERIRGLAVRDDAIEEIAEVRTLQLGAHELLVNLRVRFRPDLGVEEAASATVRLRDALRAEEPEVRFVFVEPVEDASGAAGPDTAKEREEGRYGARGEP